MAATSGHFRYHGYNDDTLYGKSSHPQVLDSSNKLHGYHGNYDTNIIYHRNGIHHNGYYSSEDEDEIPYKKTSYHITVQNHQKVDQHFLVPRLSQQADNDDVIVLPVTAHPSSLHGNKKLVTSTFYLPDEKTQREIEKRKRKEKKSRESFVNISLSSEMMPSGVAEFVSVTDGPPIQHKSVASFCDFEGKTRYKESVNIGPGLSPAWFRSRVVCHTTTSKKNYTTTVIYVPKMKPLKYESTRFVRPRHLMKSFVSYLDYNSNDSDRWYTTTVRFLPGTNKTNILHNVQMRKRTSSISSGEEEDDDVIVSDYAYKTCDVKTTHLNERTMFERYNQPPLLISSAPEKDKDGIPMQRMSHSTKMVIKSAPSQRRMTGEDFLVYLGGYAGTGDVITNGYLLQDDNGYLSDDKYISVA